MYLKIGSVQLGGFNGSLIIENFQFGATDLRTNYVDRPNGDGQLVGKDRLGSSTISIDIATNKSNLSEAIAEANKLEREWKKSSTRLTSNVPVALSYSLDEVHWYKVYGRPGAFTGLTPDVLAMKGVGRITADFIVTDHRHYSNSESSTTLTFVPEKRGGLISPLVSPLTSSGSSGESSRFVVNEGDQPAPIKVKFYGPISQPRLKNSKGQEFGLRTTIANGDWIEIDARLGTVTKRNGSQVPGLLTTRTRLSSLVLPAGQTEWFFSGSDPTATAKVEISWSDAYTGLQA